MDNIPGEYLHEVAQLGAASRYLDMLRAVADHYSAGAQKLRDLRTRGWKGASDELDRVADHIGKYADALMHHVALHPPGTALPAPAAEPHPDAVPDLPGNTGRCAAFRRAEPDDTAICTRERGHVGDHADESATEDDVHPGPVPTWPRQHSGEVCGDVVTEPGSAAYHNCQLPLGHGGDEHHDNAFRFWPRGVNPRPVRVCEQCNHDTHNCPGCGQPVGHFATACADCSHPAEPLFAEIEHCDETGAVLAVEHVATMNAGTAGTVVGYDGMCGDREPTMHVDATSCMLPAGHTGKHIGRTGARWEQVPATLAEQTDAARVAMAPSFSEQRQPMAEFVRAAKAAIASVPAQRGEVCACGNVEEAPLNDAGECSVCSSTKLVRVAPTPAAALVAQTREEVSAAVAELTGDEPIGTVVNVGGIKFVKHSNNPFAAITQAIAAEVGELSNPFAPNDYDPTTGTLRPVALGNPFRTAPPAEPKALLLPPHLVPGAPKAHQSVSSIQMISECALKYRLKYRDGYADRMPAWWNVGGTAFHRAVEHIERAHAESGGSLYPVTGPVFQVEKDAAAIWHENFTEQILRVESDTDVPPGEWKAAKGGKEARNWWSTAGEDMVRRYVHHRIDFLKHWRLLTKPDGGFAQEVEFNAVLDGVPMRGFIDSAWISLDGTVIRVEDYKSGSSDGDPFQLKTYGAALRAMGADRGPDGAQRRLVGTFYKAREGAPSAALELTTADDAEVSYRANTAQAMDRAGIFPANPSAANCSRCPFSNLCPVSAKG